MKTKFDFNIVAITKENKTSVPNNFLFDSFTRDEPLQVMKNQAREFIEHFNGEYYNKLSDNGMAFMAVSKTGDIMGVVLNSIKYKNNTEKDTRLDDKFKNADIKKVRDFFDKVEREVDVFSQYPSVDRMFEINMVMVNDVYRGQGVCKALFDKSKELALKMECQMLFVQCTSNFSARAAETLGFQCIYSLAYTDYVDENGEIVLKTHPPHTALKVYTLTL